MGLDVCDLTKRNFYDRSYCNCAELMDNQYLSLITYTDKADLPSANPHEECIYNQPAKKINGIEIKTKGLIVYDYLFICAHFFDRTPE